MRALKDEATQKLWVNQSTLQKECRCAQMKRAGIEMVSTKSSMGHAEAGAGALGIKSAVGHIQRRIIAPLTHLRNVNTHVQDVLSTTSISYMNKLPRQDAPGSIGGQHIGISSFAFQVAHHS